MTNILFKVWSDPFKYLLWTSFELMLTTQFHFGKWHSACPNCAIMQRNWPAHVSCGNMLKNHPKEYDLQTNFIKTFSVETWGESISLVSSKLSWNHYSSLTLIEARMTFSGQPIIVSLTRELRTESLNWTSRESETAKGCLITNRFRAVAACATL